MKKITLTLYAMLCLLLGNAQDKLPSFGKIDKADLEMKDCSFDPGAEAIVLIDVGDIKYEYLTGNGWMSESNYRVRIKILKESAIHRAEIKMRYYSKDRREDITNISGISYNLDAAGNIGETKMERSAVFNKQITKEYSEVSFALPNVKVGTVFEYKYKRTRTQLTDIPNWYFQEDIPVRYSAYNIVIPEYFQFTVQSTKRQEMQKVESTNAEEGIWYIMRNIVGLKEEPLSTGRDTYLQRVEFQLSKIQSPGFYHEFRTTWPKLIDELLEYESFGGAMKKNIRGTDDLNAKLAQASTTREKVRTIYNYVQSNMQWNGHYGFFSEDGIKDAWDKKNGSITDINFILIRLLKDADIPAKPLLVSTKDNGPINTYYPFLDQFNCVMAYVADGDNTYVMNAADKYNPFDLIPYDALFTSALLVDKGENAGGIVDLNSGRKFSENIFFNCNVDADAKLSGQGLIKSKDYARNIKLKKYKTAKLKAMYEDNDGIDIKLDSIAINNEKDELQSLDQVINFSGSLQSSGEYYFLPVNLFLGLGKNPFVQEERVMDIDFDFPKSYEISGTFILPENYTVSELPKNTKMIMPDTSIVLVRKVQQDDNIVTVRFTLDFTTWGYGAGSYPYVKEFFKKMYNILEERIVLKKTK